MAVETNAIAVASDGIIDYPLYERQTLSGVWNIEPNPQGPSVTPMDGYLHYAVSNQPGRNQWLRVGISTPIATASGGAMIFRVRANQIEGDEVKFTVAANLILRFTDGGNTVEWQWWDGRFHTLAASGIRADGQWHDVHLVFAADQISLFEDGAILFTWQTGVGASVNPRFDIQVLTPGASLSFDVGDIFVLPALFAEGVSTPWDYGFQIDRWPSPEAMTFTTSAGGPQVSFGEGYVRFAVDSMATRNSWALLKMTNDSPAVGILVYRVRVNTSQGSETKVTLPGDNILRVTNDGRTVEWQRWDKATGFHTLSASDIRVGDPNYVVVTLVTGAAGITLFENGQFRFTRAYDSATSWSPGVAVQHLDTGTDVSVDIGGIRLLPSNKNPGLLASDLADEILAYFPLKEALNNALLDTADLEPVGGSAGYIQGPFGKAATFEGDHAALAIPPLPRATSPSFTLSAWARVNAYPSAGDVAGIAGTLGINGDGHLTFNFQFSQPDGMRNTLFVSREALPVGEWHHVLVTYAFDESRLGIYVDGKLDSLFYLSPEQASGLAILPTSTFIGGSQQSSASGIRKLQGAVSDVMFFTQHVHQASVDMLANRSEDQDRLAIPFAIPVFIAVVAVAMFVVENIMLSQQPDPPPGRPTLKQVVDAIVGRVGQPARPGATVSRADVGIPDDMKITLDVGGEGPLDVSGFRTGLQDAINLNEMLTVQTGGFGPQIGQPIPYIVQLQPWSTNPHYPFADNFADQIIMTGAPLTPTNVDEMARVIKPGGEINLWIDDYFAEAAARLASLVGSRVETPGDIPRFRGNGANWMVRRRIVAQKS